MYFEKAKKYIYKNARPLDMARWKYLFEDGCKDGVLAVLEMYQNNDGGFGNALEPDCWNPASAPIQTWVATEIIRELHIEGGKHAIVQGILRYLDSGKDFDGKVWANSVPTNNEYPHAPWWSYTSEQEQSYNPTACLAGFIVKYADRDSSVYALGCKLVKESYQYFKDNYPLDSMHTVSCFTRLYDYLTEANVNELIDLTEFRDMLSRQIKEIITYDKSKWDIEYVCKPSLFIYSKEDEFYKENKEIADYECEFIIKTQEEDGTWAITWSWSEYPEEWAIAKNWWRCDWIIKYIKYINQMTKSN
jgi:hypothetical protein